MTSNVSTVTSTTVLPPPPPPPTTTTATTTAAPTSLALVQECAYQWLCSLFHFQPNPVLLHQLQQMNSVFGLDEESFLLGISIFYRYCHVAKEHLPPITTESELLYLVLLVLHVAQKFVSDVPYSNKSVCRIFQLNTQRLLENEIQILSALNWDLFVSLEDMEIIRKLMVPEPLWSGPAPVVVSHLGFPTGDDMIDNSPVPSLALAAKAAAMAASAAAMDVCPATPTLAQACAPILPVGTNVVSPPTSPAAPMVGPTPMASALPATASFSTPDAAHGADAAAAAHAAVLGMRAAGSPLSVAC